MKIRRDIASLPARTSKDTWSAIVKLITGADSVDTAQLEAATSVLCSAIADEHSATVPIVVKGGGSRLVIYTLHGADAMEAGLAVDLPVQRRKAAGRLQSARAKLVSLERKREYAEDKIVAEVRDSVSAIFAASERVERAEFAMGVTSQPSGRGVGRTRRRQRAWSGPVVATGNLLNEIAPRPHAAAARHQWLGHGTGDQATKRARNSSTKVETAFFADRHARSCYRVREAPPTGRFS